MNALIEYHPELAGIIESAASEEEKISVFGSESGNPRIVYTREDGETINIHSTEDPVECANQAIDLLGKIEKEGIVVLFGFGLGYFAEEIIKRFEKGHILLIYEAVPGIFRQALKLKDLSELLGTDRVKIVIGRNADNFSVIHSHHHHIINGKFWVIEHKPSVKLNPIAYDNFMKRLKEEKSLADIGISTVISRGKEFIDAFFSNVESIMRKPGVNGLRDIFKGCKAIIVSAGPSLDRNVHLLKKAKGKAVIVAAGGAIPTLLACDIIPDLVVEIDPASENIEDKFQGIPLLKKIPFISLIQYTPELIKIYPGPLFMNSVLGNVAFVWLDNTWEDKGTIECFGGSVAHLAFAAAEYIGADVIAMVGQDLSYAGERIHTIGYSDALDRKLKEGMKEKKDNILNSIPVKNIFGEDVFSIQQFLSFKTSFENRIKASGKIVVNATENGLPIEGAVNMRLMDFIDEYCNDAEEIDTFSVLSDLANSKAGYDMDLLIKKVTFARDKYSEIRGVSKKILRYIKRVKTLKGNDHKDSPELGNILQKIQKLTKRVKHPLLDLLAGYHYGLELYLKKQEIQEIDDIEDKWEMLDKQLDRGQFYYSEIIMAINLFNKQLNKVIIALRREKEVDSILSNESIEQLRRFYKAGMIYRDAGMAAQAVKYLEKVVRSQETLISLAEMYIKQFRFYEAREILTEVRGQGAGGRCKKSGVRSQESRVTELLRVCNKKINEWEERKKKVAELLKEAEANYGSHLESGYFYFRIKDFERAEKAYLKAVKNQEPGVRSQESGAGNQDSGAAAYYGLAHTYLAMDDPEKAVDALEKAIEIEPDNPILYRDLGFIAVRNNDTASAEMFLAKAIELAPQAEELYKPLASLYLSLGEREKAVALYEKALIVNPGNPVIQRDLAVFLNETIAEAKEC